MAAAKVPGPCVKTTEGRWSQCLLFIVHKKQDDVCKPAASLDPSKITGYVLLPSCVNRNPATKIHHVLLQNNVRSINDEGLCTPLVRALKSKRVEVIDILLDKSAETDVSNCDHLGYYPLQICVEMGNEKVVKLIFSKRRYVRGLPKFHSFDIHQPIFDEANLKIIGAVLRHNVNIPFRQEQSGTILHYTITKNNGGLLKQLLNLGVYLEAKRSDGLMALSVATVKGQDHNVETLLKGGANVIATASATLKDSRIPLHVAVVERYSGVVKLLLESGAPVDSEDQNGQTILQLAVENGFVEIVEYILNGCPNLKSKSNKRAFDFAISQRKEEFVEISKMLLKYGFSKNVSAADAKNSRLIHETICKNFTEIMHDLLKLGADVNCLKDYDVRRKSDTPLMTAVRFADAEMIQLLLDHGANVNALCSGMKPPLLVAVENSNVSAIKILLANGAKFGSPELLHTAAEKGCVEAIEILARNGADINGFLMGKTLLFKAAGKGFPKITDLEPQEVISLLISLGADLNVKCDDGKTPLYTAIQHANAPAVKQLLASGVEFQDPQLMLTAAKSNASEVIEILVQAGKNLNAFCGGSTALHTAAKAGCEASVAVLIKLGAIVDLKDSEGMTALHVASSEGYYGIVETLLKKGANPNIKSHSGRMPLWTALENAFPDVVKMLLMFGADLSAAKRSAAAFQYATKGGHKILKLFLEFASTDLHVSNRSFRHLADNTYSWRYGVDEKIFAHHLIKMVRAQLFVGKKYCPSDDYWSKHDLENFLDECDEELSFSEREKIGNTSISYYDILTREVRKIGCYLRNDSICNALSSSDYKKKFPIYGDMISYNYLKGNCWRELTQQAIDFCCIQIRGFSSLPLDIQEKIILPLSLEDLRNLTNACRSQPLDLAECA